MFGNLEHSFLSIGFFELPTTGYVLYKECQLMAILLWIIILIFIINILLMLPLATKG